MKATQFAPPSASSHDELDAPISDIHEIDLSRLEEVSLPARAAKVLIETLVAAGIDTYFGIPGGPAAPLFQALDEVSGARLVESRQESAAAFAAAGYFRATGRVAAVMVTAGPGATQAVTGIVNASLERVPMIVIAGDVAWSASGGRLAQDSGPDGIAIDEMVAKVTRAQVRVARPESAATQALAALDAALDPERPGPALLVVPMQHAAASSPRGRTTRRERARSARIDASSITDTADLLERARRPLIVIGGGARRHARALQQLVDALDVPFVTTPGGKGVVSELHPRSLRHGGLAASQWARAYTREGVDACLVLGTDLDDASIGPTRYVADGGRLVHVDLDARVFHRNLPASIAVVADIEAFADALRTYWSGNGMRHGYASAALRMLKTHASAFAEPEHAGDARAPIAPHRAIADLQSAFPDAMFCSDIGEHMLFALHYLTAKGPDAFHIQLSLGSMGSGIATSIGLALGAPGRRVVCVAGDGCMQMMGSEVLVAVRERLPIVFAVFNDARYNMVHHGMKQLYGHARPWDGGVVDFAKWGDALGLKACVVTRPGQIAAAARVAPLDGPLLLDIRIDREIRLQGAGRVEALQQMSAHEITGGAR
jgi:acetolactate synthase-1/2/3 large subunit